MALNFSSIVYNVSLGQIFFGLAETPQGPINFVVNGMIQKLGPDFTILPSGATWISSDFTLTPGDVVELQYLTQN